LAWRVWLHLRVSTRRRCAASSSRTFMGPPFEGPIRRTREGGVNGSR
jgi:hypothetical protein